MCQKTTCHYLKEFRLLEILEVFPYFILRVLSVSIEHFISFGYESGLEAHICREKAVGKLIIGFLVF